MGCFGLYQLVVVVVVVVVVLLQWVLCKYVMGCPLGTPVASSEFMYQTDKCLTIHEKIA